MDLLVEKRILVECFLDTRILNFLGFKPNEFHGSNGDLSNVMLNPKLSKTKFVTVTDEDKPKNWPPYFKNFATVESFKNDGLEYKQFGENRFLILLSNESEEWLNMCRLQLENPPKLPYNTIKEFKKRTKTKDALFDPQISNFLNTIKQRNPPAFQRLSNLLHQHFPIK